MYATEFLASLVNVRHSASFLKNPVFGVFLVFRDYTDKVSRRRKMFTIADNTDFVLIPILAILAFFAENLHPALW